MGNERSSKRLSAQDKRVGEAAHFARRTAQAIEACLCTMRIGGANLGSAHLLQSAYYCAASATKLDTAFLISYARFFD